MVFKDGAWGAPELVQEPFLQLHVGATALHYGQACFEGLKAFTHQDGSVNIFRPDENAKRMQNSAERVMMEAPSVEDFVEACKMAVKDNIAYVPPYGSDGALYLRPLLFGSGPRIGLQPADEYTFLVMVTPVGSYYKGGMGNPVKGLLVDSYDRAAPRGVGHVKVAGNYAADLKPNIGAKNQGFPIALYLDAATQTLVEEFSTSNFVGIKRESKKYVTPVSGSVLPSITNKSLMQLANADGYTVEQRDVPLDELHQFDEVLAVGTAVVVTPVGSVTRFGKETSDETVYTFGTNQDQVGPTTKHLYDRVRNIQNGVEEDTFGWNVKVV